MFSFFVVRNSILLTTYLRKIARTYIYTHLEIIVVADSTRGTTEVHLFSTKKVFFS